MLPTGSLFRGDADGVLDPFLASIASRLKLPDIDRGMIGRKLGENFWESFSNACSRFDDFTTGLSGTGYIRHMSGGSVIAYRPMALAKPIKIGTMSLHSVGVKIFLSLFLDTIMLVNAPNTSTCVWMISSRRSGQYTLMSQRSVFKQKENFSVPGSSEME